MPLASEMARMLESDPVATAQIKEHIKPERLCELLGIEPPEPDLEDLLRRYSRSEVLQALNNQ